MRKTLLILLVWAMCTSTALGQDYFRGRVVAATETSDIVVTLQRQNRQIVAQAMTDSRGSFTFSDVLRAETIDNYVFLVVQHEGFKPYRERLSRTDIEGGGLFSIFLDPEGTSIANSGGIVDLRELQADISDEAREEYEEALEDAEDGDHDEAAELLERAVELSPEYYDAWINLGGQYNLLERFEDARNAYEQAAALNPNGLLVHLNLGALRYQEGERLRASVENPIPAFEAYAEARTSLERAIELDPFSSDARFYLGATLYRMTLYDESETLLQSVIEIEAQHAQSRLMLINVYARLQRYEDALDQANTFLDENDDAPERSAIERVKSQLEETLGR